MAGVCVIDDVTSSENKKSSHGDKMAQSNEMMDENMFQKTLPTRRTMSEPTNMNIMAQNDENS